MSLVNNMLRDLDQRRKESDSSGTSVKLMPASDMPVERRNRVLFYVLGCLVVAAAGLTWLWLDTRSDGDSPRPLNIRPAVVDNASSQGVQSVPPVAVASTPTSEPSPADSATSSPTPAAAVASTIVEAVVPEPVEAAEASPAVSQQREQPAQPAPGSPASPADPQPGAVTPISDSVAQELVEPASLPADTGSVAIRGQQPAESVKNQGAMSAEERDTLAVQEALRLIQDNESAAAYAHLEQHIINNRYAHQSRETFAKLLVNDGETLAAYNLLESGLALAPNHPGYKKVKARILISTGRMEEAVDLLSRRAPEVSADLEYHELLATAQLASRDYEGALASYTGLVQQNRAEGKWWYGFAASQDSLGNRRAAYQAYNQAMQQANLSPNLRRRSQERLSALSQ